MSGVTCLPCCRGSSQDVTLLTKARSSDSGSCAVIMRGFTHDGEDFSYAAGGTWLKRSLGCATWCVGAGAMRGRERLGWSVYLAASLWPAATSWRAWSSQFRTTVGWEAAVILPPGNWKITKCWPSGVTS